MNTWAKLLYILGAALVLHGAALATPVASQPAVAAWREQARALEHGEGVTRDIESAIELYCKAALAGDAQAQYDLGWIYANGRGVARSDAYAAHFFQQAAHQGDAPAQRMLARMTENAAPPPCVLAAQQAAEIERLRHIEADLADQQQQMANGFERLIDTAREQQVMAIVRRLAPEYGIHPGLAFAVIRAESNFNPLAVSNKNAQGLMQLIPETAARFNVRKPFDPEQNIRGGLAYLRWLLAYFRGDVSLALAAYNAGEGAVNRHRGVPPFQETQNYLRRIREVFQLPYHPFDARVTAPSPELARIRAARR